MIVRGQRIHIYYIYYDYDLDRGVWRERERERERERDGCVTEYSDESDALTGCTPLTTHYVR